MSLITEENFSEQFALLRQNMTDLCFFEKTLMKAAADDSKNQLDLLNALEHVEIRRKAAEEKAARTEAEVQRLGRSLQEAEEDNQRLKQELRKALGRIACLESETASLRIENRGLQMKLTVGEQILHGVHRGVEETSRDRSNDVEGDFSEDSGYGPLTSTMVDKATEWTQEALLSPINTRKHIFKLFQPTMHKCDFCRELMTFGASKALKCLDCHMRVHGRCNIHLRAPCAPRLDAKVSDKNRLDIADFCPRSATRKIPFPVVQCVAALESRGLGVQGLYRNLGNDADIKKLYEEFLSGRPFPDLNDQETATITGCLVKFLSSFNEHLVPSGKLSSFRKALRTGDETALKNGVADLPQVNRQTLAYLCCHLQDVASRRDINRMGVDELSLCLAPSVVELSPYKNISEATTDSVYVLRGLLGLTSNFWIDVLAL
ncbi:hypothetical protein QR680_014242 [Steinernema hermaphroditum]|uniref:Rho-GAP domain-containing protein n=1 Tax=Steinernema hermaphroditum TaxID=289476 RepID=A0AA39I876_9BILA|nr:hypothetical protein QR680_014242 [Steinernema hermaphroditum]